ncbi:hypothetical protein BB559_000772 [Furculomyces boomerangus]|uniref:Palmitoyl-protein thioesterase 1 n=2 Tax=Harpellales TaxID=61421 RepID=A0A2T9Z451_9FUNG|nr:hypothetical protein BB559_000772 [Furculomyces boomerangus]PVZ98763.1 hypothetical protein BB558_005230 [Smittium angustum]PWA03222.1 hypothetical protein BB558_000562 [Smittium angustum]
MIFHSFEALCIFVLLTLIVKSSETPTPVVMWHGMGDTCCSDTSMYRVKRLIEGEIPNVYVHSIMLGSSPEQDRRAGFYGNINEQIDVVCKQLQENAALKDGYYGIGFSQGGLFMRGLLQRCPYPKMKKLVTFGSPHSGISSPPECAKGDFICQGIKSILFNSAYSPSIQRNFIQAQFYKDPKRIDDYLKESIFLTDINNEIKINTTYIENIKKLEKFVMIKFSLDKTIVPNASTWFGFYNDMGDQIPLQDTTLYKEDRLGLKWLDESGKIDFLVCDGIHMQIKDEYLLQITSKYLRDSKTGRFIAQKQHYI